MPSFLLDLGLFSLLDAGPSTAAWAGYQLLAAIRSGFIITTTLLAPQAVLLESDVAASTATWAILRSFGSVWGVAIPAAIFNNRISSTIATAGLELSPELAQMLTGSNAYQQASSAFVTSLPPELQVVVIGTYTRAMRLV